MPTRGQGMLASRAKEVVTLITGGDSPKEIADRTTNGIEIVDGHRVNILEELGVRDRPVLTQVPGPTMPRRAAKPPGRRRPASKWVRHVPGTWGGGPRWSAVEPVIALPGITDIRLQGLGPGGQGDLGRARTSPTTTVHDCSPLRDL